MGFWSFKWVLDVVDFIPVVGCAVRGVQTGVLKIQGKNDAAKEAGIDAAGNCLGDVLEVVTLGGAAGVVTAGKVAKAAAKVTINTSKALGKSAIKGAEKKVLQTGAMRLERKSIISAVEKKEASEVAEILAREGAKQEAARVAATEAFKPLLAAQKAARKAYVPVLAKEEWHYMDRLIAKQEAAKFMAKGIAANVAVAGLLGVVDTLQQHPQELDPTNDLDPRNVHVSVPEASKASLRYMPLVTGVGVALLPWATIGDRAVYVTLAASSAYVTTNFQAM